MKSSREQFEEWAISSGSDMERYKTGIHNGDFKNPVMRKMWLAWQASRASVEVQLPFRYGCPKGLYDGSSQGVWDEAVDACADSISDAGLSFSHEHYRG